MSKADRDILDDELDALLEQARWPQSPPQSAARLQGRSRALTYAQPRRIHTIGWLAAAAGLVLAIGGTWFMWAQGGRVPSQVVHHVPPVPPSPIATPLPPVTVQRSTIVPQAPSPRERLAIMTPSSAIVNVPAEVRSAIDATADDRHADALAGLRRLRTNAVERELALAFATSHSDPHRRAAIRLLGELGGPSSAALLMRVARDETFAAEAMPGVARLGGVEPLDKLARSAQSAPRREAVAQLLAMGSEPAVEAFLSLVLDDATRTDALAALQGSSAPPVERLIGALDDAKVDHRFAAAKALGLLCHRDNIGAALRRMVDANRHRREALAALLSCRSEEATTFIKAARARASIDAEVRAVQSELQRMF